MDDLTWFVRSRIRIMRARERRDFQEIYLGDPRDLHMRVRRRAFASLLYLTLMVPLLGCLGTALKSSGLAAWPEWISIWALGFLGYLATRYGVPGLRRALHIYAIEWLCLLPVALFWANAGLRITLHTFGITPTLGLLALLAILLVPIVVELPRRMASLEAALAEGHLRRSLDAKRALWDPGHDFEDPSASQTSCLILLLAVLGPPLLLALAETMGLSSLQVIGLAFMAAGYLAVRGGAVTQTARLLMFLRLEDRLGRPILIRVEDDSARTAEGESGDPMA